MPDPGLMLRDLEEFRGASRRPWIVIALVVAVLTAAAIWLIKRLEGDAPAQQPVAPAIPAAVTNVAAATPPAPHAMAPEAARLLAAAQADEAADRLVEARTNYLALVARNDTAAARAFVEERLGAVNILLVTTPRAMPGKIDYAIRAGDSLKLLARRFGVTAALIERGNNIANPSRIHAGDRMRILEKPRFEIAIGKRSNDLLLTLNGAFFKRYRVGTGQFGRTPVGSFRIENKIENPPWWRPDGKVVPFGDPENILGTRWMTLAATGETPPAKGYGIHGTWDDTSLGKQSSAGCIRMRNADVEELYMLVTEGTPVRIAE